MGLPRISALASICKVLPFSKYLGLGKAHFLHRKCSPLCVREIFINHNGLRPQESSQILVFFALRARGSSVLVSHTLSHRKGVYFKKSNPNLNAPQIIPLSVEGEKRHTTQLYAVLFLYGLLEDAQIQW